MTPLALAVDLLALAQLCPTEWRGARVPGISNRDDIIRELRDGWVNGPHSVPDECRFIIGVDPDPCTVAVVGNGPKRTEVTRLLVLLGRNATAFAQLIIAAAEVIAKADDDGEGSEEITQLAKAVAAIGATS